MNRVVTTEEGEQFAESMGCPFFEVSAKAGTNINELFDSIIEKIGETVMARAKTSKNASANAEVFISNEKKSTGCC